MSNQPLVRLGKVRPFREIAHKKHAPVVAVDFDGTIHNPDDVEEGFRMGRPFHGAREVLSQLREAGARIVVLTVRAYPPENAKHVEDWLRHYDIPFDEVTAIKPRAVAYVDDRAIRFEGDWDAIATELLAVTYLAKWKGKA